MRYILLCFFLLCLVSCWKPYGDRNGGVVYAPQKTWGSKPVYAAIDSAKEILYDPAAHPVINAGNIYAFNKFIFQVDVGRGIHVIDNAVPSKAERIGFISIKGCEQVSIQGNYLYTNSYSDLVTIDISNPVNMKIVSRLPNTFPDYYVDYPLAEPEESGYFECPQFYSDSVVVSWVKDSVYMNCYKN